MKIDKRLKIYDVRRELRSKADFQKAKILARFFKTGKGEYGEGDKFLGIVVPVQRGLVKKYFRDLKLTEAIILLHSQYHEERLTALLILVAKYEKGEADVRKEIFETYIRNTKHINSWDLVDLTADKIVGEWLADKDKKPIYKLARSKNIWERRIAMLSTFCYIKKGKAELALEIAEKLVFDQHDLIQKAVGWMLREIGKRCGSEEEEIFLRKYCRTMPRTALRYAIERMPLKKKNRYLGR